MKLVRYILFAASFTLVINIALAQNTFRGFPPDLNVESLIFLSYDLLEVNPDAKKSEIKAREFRNVKANEANKQLKLATEAYPYGFIIAKRSQLDSLYEQGYLYVLENDMMEKHNSGEALNAGMSSNDVSEMYIMNLKNGSKYYLFQIVQSYVYYYKGIMKKFTKQVEKEFY